MFQTTLVRENDVERLGEAVCGVLETVGLLVQNQELLQALAAAGAKTDPQAERAWIPRKAVQAFVETLRAEGPRDVGLDLYGDSESTGAAAADEDATGRARRFTAPPTPELGTQVAQFYYDYGGGGRRPGNREDLITLIKLADVLHPDSPAGHAVVQEEVPPKMEALESAMLLAEYASNPGEAFAWYVDQVDYLRELGDILGIPEWFTWGSICFAHPLRMDKDVADKFVLRVREGSPTGLTAMPIAGFTAPVTAEGFIAVACAEHLATWFAARAVNPEVPLSGSMWAGSIDMRTGYVSYSAFDAMYYAFASVEFLRRWTGINIPVGGGEYCDAREPGMYAVMEKAYKAMTIAAFTGVHPAVGEGMLEVGKTICPAQLMLERDLTGGVLHFARELRPSPDTVAMPSIEEVELGIRTNHMTTAHTLAHFRTNLWLPKLVDRSGWAGAESDRAMLDKAQGRVDELLTGYRKPEGREDRLHDMRKVVERARKKLVG